MRPRLAAFIALALLTGTLPLAGRSLAQTSEGSLAKGRETEAVVLTGASFPTLATLGDVALKANSLEGAQCLIAQEGGPSGAPDTPVTSSDPCSHNEYEKPDFSSAEYLKNQGVPIDQLLGYRWTGEGFEQIPFQVDEMFIHYISNDISGFAFYSETDQHTTYAFDREGFRWTDSDPNDPCLARPASEVATDPVPGLDTDDELVFMARDAGTRAPDTAPMPAGIKESYEVAVTDPINGTSSFVYVMKAAEDGPHAAFDETNGYVRYERDADSNVFLFSESSFENYGRAPAGPWYDPATGVCHSDEAEWKQHRPGDQATITTPRYRFRYEGRWLMTELNISSSENGDWTYGPDVIDQWKARAFQQRPGGETPCCGYEEEVNNWGGSSILMGELSGPVRTIRETWGADSGTNVVRREIFYRDEIRFISFLRVHVIPPADGIYSQWDYNAGIMTRYYNPLNPNGVPIDGCNDDEGNARVYVNRDGVAFDPDGKGPHPCGEQDQASIGKEGTAGGDRIDNDIDIPDPAFSGVNAGLNWEQIAGPHGTLVSRYQLHKATPGSAHTVVTVPYYRDDACFDDGTGTNPGPHLDPRDVDGDEESDANYTAEDGSRQPRTCWDHSTDPTPALSDPRYWQASIGTHGVHIELIADSDNAHTTLPLTEIDGDQRVVVLPGEQPNVGETYGRQPEKPLLVSVTPESRDQSPNEQVATSLEITGDTSGQITDNATLSARLTHDGAGVEGKEITFTLDGREVGSATTDNTGVASVSIAVSGPARVTEQTATFAGDATHAGSSATAPFEVRKDDPSLTLSVSREGNNATGSATLSDADDRSALAGRTIRFLVNGREVATAVTDASGTATAAFKAKKDDTVRAIFDGDDSYNSASS